MADLRPMWLRAMTGLLFLGLCLGLLLILSPKAAPRALVGPQEWRVEGVFPQYPLWQASNLDVPDQILASPDLVLWRSWSPSTGATEGMVHTVPFEAVPFVAVPYYGFPGEQEENRIFLRCIASGVEMVVAAQRTNNQWATSYLRVGSGFCSGKVELVAMGAPRYYVGVGTPFAIDAATFYAEASIFPKLTIVVATWLILCLLTLSLGYCASLLFNIDVLAAGFILTGAASMGVFLAFYLSPQWGTITASGIVLASLVVIGAIWCWDRIRLMKILRYSAPAALVWLGIAISYAAYVASIDNGGGSWSVNGMFSPLRWSTDNQLPERLAELLFDGAPVETMRWGAWLASDRTPLMSALLLVFRSVVIAPLSTSMGSDFVSQSYHLCGLTILASWSAVLYCSCRTYGRSCAAYIVCAAFFTAFFLFNTAYIWPKMIAGSYVFIAFALLTVLHRRATSNPAQLTFVALAAVLGYLCHGSQILVLVPLAIVYSRTILSQGALNIGVASVIGFACLVPWLWWQTFVQPGGNALIRYALADHYVTGDRNAPIIDSVLVAYRHLGFSGWLSNKFDGIVMLLGLKADWTEFGEVAQYSPGASTLGGNRVLDFFLPLRSLGIAVPGLLFLAAGGWSGAGNLRRVAADAAAVGLLSVVLTLVVLLPLKITHVQAYGAMLLLFFAGAATLSASWSLVKYTTLAVAIGYFLLVWIAHPLAVALRVDVVALAVALAATVSVVFLLFPAPQQRDLVRTSEEP